MSLLRNVAGDLVAKRLWPVALALVAAIVAVPVLLGGGGESPAPAGTPAASGATAEPAPGLLTLAEDRSRVVPRGTARDPFRAPAPRRAEGDGSSASAGPPAGGGAPGGMGSFAGGIDAGIVELPGLDDIAVTPIGDGSTGGSGSGSTGGSGSGSGAGATTTPDDAKEEQQESYTVDLRFGPAGDVRDLDDVPRLSPLPNQADPFFVFLGVLDDRRTAVFLVSSDATATGEGTCRPSATRCDRIELRVGQTEYFDFTTPEGEVVQYQLDVRAVQRAGRARASRASADRRASGGILGGHRTDVRHGPAGADDATLVTRRDLDRLTPLPGGDAPGVVFLGVLPGGDSAVFLAPAGAAASGDVTCGPEPGTCTTIEVPVGGTARVGVPAPDGTTAEHRLVVDAITEIPVAGAARARAPRVGGGHAGRALVRRLAGDLGAVLADLRYDPARGTLARR